MISGQYPVLNRSNADIFSHCFHSLLEVLTFVLLFFELVIVAIVDVAVVVHSCPTQLRMAA